MLKRIWVKRHTRKDGVIVKGHYREVGNHNLPSALAGARFVTYRGRHFPTDAGPYPAEVDGVKGQASYSHMGNMNNGGEWQVFFRRTGASPASSRKEDNRGWVFGNSEKERKKRANKKKADNEPQKTEE